MNKAQHSATMTVLRKIADELDELTLIVDSLSKGQQSEELDELYLKFTDAWYWTDAWLNEQEIINENPRRI